MRRRASLHHTSRHQPTLCAPTSLSLPYECALGMNIVAECRCKEEEEEKNIKSTQTGGGARHACLSPACLACLPEGQASVLSCPLTGRQNRGIQSPRRSRAATSLAAARKRLAAPPDTRSQHAQAGDSPASLMTFTGSILGGLLSQNSHLPSILLKLLFSVTWGSKGTTEECAQTADGAAIRYTTALCTFSSRPLTLPPLHPFCPVIWAWYENSTVASSPVTASSMTLSCENLICVTRVVAVSLIRQRSVAGRDCWFWRPVGAEPCPRRPRLRACGADIREVLLSARLIGCRRRSEARPAGSQEGRVERRPCGGENVIKAAGGTHAPNTVGSWDASYP